MSGFLLDTNVLSELELLRNDRSLSEDEFWKRLIQAFTEHFSDMTKRERSEVMDKFGWLLYSFETDAARLGIPRPGNNPRKPN